MTEQVEPETFKPMHHKLKQHIEAKLEALLKEYASQFAQDETSIGTTPLTELMIDTGTSEPVSQKTLLHLHETLPMGQGWNRKNF